MIYLQLFLSFLQIGAFSFGGGYAAMPLIQEQVVLQHSWLTMDSFSNLVTIAEMTPGPIAVNAATFVGTQIAGIPGAIIATFGCILPSCLFVTALAYIYTKIPQSLCFAGNTCFSPSGCCGHDCKGRRLYSCLCLLYKWSGVLCTGKYFFPYGSLFCRCTCYASKV